MTGADDAATGAFGSLERLGDVGILRYERRLAHPRERVWWALADDADLAAWFPTTIEGDRRPGAPLRFSFRQGEGQPFDGEMLAFDPPRLMELRWADDVLRFELDPDAGGSAPGCILRLTVTFPEYGKAARDAAGWHVCLDQLSAHCEGTELPGQESDRWRVVHRNYRERLGPESSVIGPPQEWEEPHDKP